MSQLATFLACVESKGQERFNITPTVAEREGGRDSHEMRERARELMASGFTRTRCQHCRQSWNEWGSLDMAVGQFAVCLPGARAGPQARLYNPKYSSKEDRASRRYRESVLFFCPPVQFLRVEGEVFAVSRGFPLPRAVSELRSPGAACSTISPPAVPYTVSPVSTVYQKDLSGYSVYREELTFARVTIAL